MAFTCTAVFKKLTRWGTWYKMAIFTKNLLNLSATLCGADKLFSNPPTTVTQWNDISMNYLSTHILALKLLCKLYETIISPHSPTEFPFVFQPPSQKHIFPPKRGFWGWSWCSHSHSDLSRGSLLWRNEIPLQTTISIIPGICHRSFWGRTVWGFYGGAWMALNFTFHPLTWIRFNTPSHWKNMEMCPWRKINFLQIPAKIKSAELSEKFTPGRENNEQIVCIELIFEQFVTRIEGLLFSEQGTKLIMIISHL